MYVALVSFTLGDRATTVGELREWVSTQALDVMAAATGVVLKTWFYNEVENLWGGIYVVQDISGFQQPPNGASGARGPLGSFPSQVVWGHLEAATVGPGGIDALLEVVGDEGRRIFEPQPLPTWPLLQSPHLPREPDPGARHARVPDGYSVDPPPTGFQNRR